MPDIKIQTVPYCADRAADWNEWGAESCNGTFLFHRNYMKYHGDRLKDCSLLFYSKEKLNGILPAGIHGDEVRSHGGLTYGGLIWKKGTHFEEVRQMLQEACVFYKSRIGAKRLLYSPVPYIYHAYPAQEDLYVLFKMGAQLKARSLSACVDLQEKLPYSTLRRRKLHKAQRANLIVEKLEQKNSWEIFWNILTKILHERHNAQPVHSLEEIWYLKQHFPWEIQLHAVMENGEMLAGCVLYVTRQVVHVQYIAANETGRAVGALEFLFHDLMEKFKVSHRYLDFGRWTEQGGEIVNQGLMFQKEGLGGRAVCYDQYEIKL